jgi:apolipoprotein N-acyltransferase
VIRECRVTLPMALCLGLGSGLMIDAALRFEELAYLAWVALIPLLFILEFAPSKRLAALAFLTFSLPPALWVYEGGLYEYFWLILLCCFIFATVHALIGIYAILIRQRLGPNWMWLGLIATWSGLMFLLMQPNLTRNFAHFGWAAISVSSVGTVLLPAAAWSGPTGLGALLWAINLALYQVFRRFDRVGLSWLIGVAALVTLSLVFTPGIKLAGSSSQINIMQSPFSQADAILSQYDPSIATTYLQNLQYLSQNRSGLLVFPEQTLPGILELEKPLPKEVQSLLSGFPETILGVVTQRQDKKFNTAQHWQQSHFEEAYVKRVLMPGGEDDLTPGTSSQPVRAIGVRWGVLICYESIIPWVAREAVQSGAEALMVLTSDGFAGGANTPEAHWRGSVALAAALGRPLVFASKTGPSSFSDAFGTVQTKTMRDTNTVLEGRVQAVTGLTLYAAFGDWLGALGWLMGVAICFLKPTHAASTIHLDSGSQGRTSGESIRSVR